MGLQSTLRRLTGRAEKRTSEAAPTAAPVAGGSGAGSEPSGSGDPMAAMAAAGQRPAGAPGGRRRVPVVLPEGGPAEVEDVRGLIDDGELVAAVDRLVQVNRGEPAPDLEVALVALRHRAAMETPPGAGREPWPPTYADPFPDVVGTLPEVRADQLTTDVLGGAVAHHGCLIVRGVFSPDQIERTVAAIERTHEHYAAGTAEPGGSGGAGGPGDAGGPGAGAAADGAWYRPFRTDAHDEMLRRMVARQGGTWLADSPSSTARILDELETAGVTDAIAGHLGERPWFSLQKSTLRRSLPVNNLVAWHQDGSFYDDDVRTMNVWVALSRCGGDHPTPGMEVIPRRFDEILPVDGVMTPHSISYDLIDELAVDCPTIIPEFEPGDAMIFDEHFVHRTHLSEGMTEIRYALECWFFAPSHVTTAYTPFLV